MKPGDLRKRARVHRSRHPRRRFTVPDYGERLATVQREDGQELRVTWDRFKGHPFVRLALWRDDDGTMVPGRSVTVRVSELAALADAVADAMDRADGELRPLTSDPP